MPGDLFPQACQLGYLYVTVSFVVETTTSSARLTAQVLFLWRRAAQISSVFGLGESNLEYMPSLKIKKYHFRELAVDSADLQKG